MICEISIARRSTSARDGMPTMTSRTAVVLAFLLAVLYALPALTAPPLEDDVTHQLMLHNGVAGVHWTPFDLYDFIGAPSRSVARLQETGAIPWYASPNLQFRFFRPLSSASLAADYWLFGNHAWALRLDSLAWFLVALGFAAALYRRILAPGPAALATILYAGASGHVVPVSWAAARHTVLGTALALAACWCYARGRDGWRPGRWLGPLIFVADLCASEMALGAVAIIAAWELLGRRGSFGRRLRELLPYGAIAAGYLAFYVHAGYGARGSAAYLDPTAGASALAIMIRRLGILIGTMVTSVPADLVGGRSIPVQIAAAVLGVLALVAVAGVLRYAWRHVPPDERRVVGWGTAAALAATLPGTLTLASGRTLALAVVPAGAVMAIVVVRALQTVRTSTPGLGRTAAAVVVCGLTLAVVIGGPFFRVRGEREFARVARAQQALASELPPCAGTMVIVNGSDPSVAHVGPALLALRGRPFGALRVLSMSPVHLRIEHVTTTGFDLRSLDKRAPTMQERIYRADPVSPGTQVSLPGFDVNVLEGSRADPDGFWEGSLVHFDFGRPIDSPDFCFIEWTHGRIRPMTAPRPGDVIDISPQFGPVGW